MMCIPNPSVKPWMARIIKSGRSVKSVDQWVSRSVRWLDKAVDNSFIFVCCLVSKSVGSRGLIYQTLFYVITLTDF